MEEFGKRLKEPSSAASIAGILALAGMSLNQVEQMNLEQAVMGIGALILFVRGIFAKEGK